MDKDNKEENMKSPEILYIELAQLKSNAVSDNGDYSINLDKPIFVKNGDSVSLYKSFVDTSRESDNIVIENDIQLNISFLLYARNWWGQQTAVEEDGVFLNGALTPDNLDYIVCNKVGTEVDSALMTEIFYGKVGKAPSKGKFVGGFTGIYQYVDPEGNVQKTNISFPREDVTHGRRTVAAKNLSIRCRADSFIDLTPIEVLTKAGVPPSIPDPFGPTAGFPARFTYSTIPPEAKDVHFTPFIQTKNVMVKAGEYSPTALAQYVTEELTRLDELILEGNPVASPFLTSGEDLGMANGISGSQGAINASDKVCVDAETGQKIFLPVTGGRNSNATGSGSSFLIGASQVGLEFQDGNLFTWAFAHTPFYVGEAGTTKNIGIAYCQISGGADDGKYSVVNKYGGIAFTDLSANIINQDGTIGDAYDFWSGDLGFNVGDLVVVPQDVPQFTFNDNNGTSITATSTQLQTNLKDGVNMTGGAVTIDSTVNKGSDTPYSYTALTGTLALPAEISGTFGIQAEVPYNVDDTLKSPYFRLDVECAVKNKIIGEKTLFRNTVAIIGRYYESNSYNTGTQSDSLIYVHNGDPVMLSSFNIRILDENGQLSVDLGDNNTIFLQVVKNS